MRSFTLHSGFMFSSLASDRGHAALRHLAKLHQRRVADALRDVLLDPSGKSGGSHEASLYDRNQPADMRQTLTAQALHTGEVYTPSASLVNAGIGTNASEVIWRKGL